MSKKNNKTPSYKTGPEELDNKKQVDRMLNKTVLPEDLRREIEKLRREKQGK